MMMKKEKCPVCGNYTLEERHINEICPVCVWEDDLFVRNEDDFSPANGMTLAEARGSWKEIRSCHGMMKQYCRGPYPSELPWIYEHDAEKSLAVMKDSLYC